MTAAVEVARSLVRLAAAEPGGEPMTALRLHKLLYYCQGWHLAWYGEPLFADRIEAWRYGPVVPVVYAEPWGQGDGPTPDAGEPLGLSERQRGSIAHLWQHHRRYSAVGLMEMSRRESPWQDHFHPDATGHGTEEIPVAALADFFGRKYRRLTGDEPGSAAVPTDRGTPLEELRRQYGL